MAYHPRIEEVSDSDLDSDPSEMDPSDFLPSPSGSQPPILSPSKTPFDPPTQGQGQVPIRTTPPDPAQAAAQKKWQCLYPVYFDSSRTRAQGRRVSKNLAVANPLATEIADACASLGLKPKIEVMSVHPKDWANVGRVRVPLKESQGVRRMLNGREMVKNKHHLYILVSDYLRAHPTTEQTPLRLPIVPGEKPEVKPPPAIPRGWKMNSILPLHSPAVKGNGVSDNPLREAMAQLGEIPGGAGGSGEGGGGGAVEEGGKKKKKGKKG
ncbi:signal recognition particle subunit [Thelotrema lepadinum]|nr:signal recognition particle subunit [Thelotrema lepadinum]